MRVLRCTPAFLRVSDPMHPLSELRTEVLALVKECAATPSASEIAAQAVSRAMEGRRIITMADIEAIRVGTFYEPILDADELAALPLKSSHV